MSIICMVLLCVVGLLTLGQLVASYGVGCLPGEACMGPGQTRIFGMGFRSDIIAGLVSSFAAGLVASVIAIAIMYSVRKDIAKALAGGGLVFCGIFLLLQLFAYWMRSRIVY